MSLNAVSIFDLSPPEKLLHEWQKEELARRKANLMSSPASGLSWDEIKRRVRNRYGR
jgi:putative addiction module component (TIGR02574 family)